jgi:hypothetical protein
VEAVSKHDGYHRSIDLSQVELTTLAVALLHRRDRRTELLAKTEFVMNEA